MDTVNDDRSRRTSELGVASLAADGVEYAVGSFIDIIGRAKSKVVPIDAPAATCSPAPSATRRAAWATSAR